MERSGASAGGERRPTGAGGDAGTRRSEAEAERRSETVADRRSVTGSAGRPASARRRALLAAGATAAATALAGCSLDLLPGDPAPEPATGTPTDTSRGAADEGPAGGVSSPTPTPEVDVVGLLFREAEGGRRFEVTLSAPPTSGGADWWQLETADGERLVRHSLEAPRIEDRFTTARRVELPDDATRVVVRAHGVDVGYGGRAMVADLRIREIAVHDQGPEPRPVEDSA